MSLRTIINQMRELLFIYLQWFRFDLPVLLGLGVNVLDEVVLNETYAAIAQELKDLLVVVVIVIRTYLLTHTAITTRPSYDKAKASVHGKICLCLLLIPWLSNCDHFPYFDTCWNICCIKNIYCTLIQTIDCSCVADVYRQDGRLLRSSTLINIKNNNNTTDKNAIRIRTCLEVVKFPRGKRSQLVFGGLRYKVFCPLFKVCSKLMVLSLRRYIYEGHLA